MLLIRREKLEISKKRNEEKAKMNQNICERRNMFIGETKKVKHVSFRK